MEKKAMGTMMDGKDEEIKKLEQKAGNEDKFSCEGVWKEDFEKLVKYKDDFKDWAVSNRFM